MERSSLAEVWRVLSESVFQEMETWRRDIADAGIKVVERDLPRGGKRLELFGREHKREV